MIITPPSTYQMASRSFPFGTVILKYHDEIVYSLAIRHEIATISSGTSFSHAVFQQIDEYCCGSRTKFGFPLSVHGTRFQQAVFEAIQTIPYGETRTYQQIAVQIGQPTASRAVGTACGKNPVLLALPCHRVVSSSGKLTGFAGGVQVKKYLLELEQKTSVSN